ncbi:MAG: preprotein translocase subunit SecG [Candidatus Omnitrophica bacterium]|nr:preprotein translocase subunit SecG [Candidatus Omnitrophota bacterium]
MQAVLLVIHVIVSLFLIFIILIQSGKGEGLSDVFGGGSSQTTIFGSRTGNFLTKATTASAIIFMITCLSLALISKKSGSSSVQQELLKEQTVEKIQEMMGNKEETAKDTSKTPSQPAVK